MKSRLSWASKRWLLLYLELDPSDWRQNWKCGPSSIWYQRLSTLPPFKRYQPAGCFRPWVWDMDEPWYGPWFTATSIIVINAVDWKVARLAWTTDKGWINWGKIPRTWLLECSAFSSAGYGWAGREAVWTSQWMQIQLTLLWKQSPTVIRENPNQLPIPQPTR